MSVAAVRKALSSLPKSLDETYDRILLEIDETHQPEVRRTLKALIVTVEPLTLEDIVEILAVDLDSVPPRFDQDARLFDPRSVLTMCSSLVTVSTKRRFTDSSVHDNVFFPSTQVQCLRLAHASVADYLTQSKSLSTFHFSDHSARQFLTQTCLTYLLNAEFANGHERSKVGQRRKDFPFLPHAIRFWPMYLEKLNGDSDDDIEARTKELLQAFFATSKLPRGGNFAFWVGMLIPTSPDDYVLNTHPLYYAASYGLTEVVRLILDTEKDIHVDKLGGRAHASALHVAVYRDHLDVVKLLLERGADPKLPNDIGESPLYWAKINFNPEMADLLIQYISGPELTKKDDNSSAESQLEL